MSGKDSMPEIKRINPPTSEQWRLMIGSAVATAVSAALFLKEGIYDTDLGDSARWGAATLGSFSVATLAKRWGFRSPRYEQKKRMGVNVKAGRNAAVVGAVTGLGIFGASYVQAPDGSATVAVPGATEGTSLNGDVTTTIDAATTLPAPGEVVIVSAVVSETGQTVAFAYNNGNPIPAGQCAIDAPITEETSDDEVKILQTKLNEAGFDAGVVDGKAGKQTSAAVSRLQVAFDMPEVLAFDKSTRWNQSDCYQASITVPGFSDMWVSE